jgi:hypothetical protein
MKKGNDSLSVNDSLDIASRGKGIMTITVQIDDAIVDEVVACPRPSRKNPKA